MAKARRLASGAWNVSVYSHTENGKRKYESFTAWTKQEAELKAAEYKANKSRLDRSDLKVCEAIDGYIKAKSGVLSPSTIREYIRMQKTNYSDLDNVKIKKLTLEQIQLWVSGLSLKLSAKSVRNTYALLSAALALYQPDRSYKVTLPTKARSRPSSPDESIIRLLLDKASPELRKCILLGIRGLREGEVSALQYEDIKDGIAHIHADFVKGPDGKWVYKEIPKTSGSDRFVKVPDFGQGEGFVIKWKPITISKRFQELRNSLGLTIRFHDLRHFFASSAAVLNIPDIYTADFGGWARGGSIMKSVYQNNIKSMSDYYQDKMDDYFTGLEKKCKMKCKMKF